MLLHHVFALMSIVVLQFVAPLYVYPDFELDCHTTQDQSKVSLNHSLSQLASNTILVLSEPGCYYVDSYFLITHIHNLTITGSGPSDQYIITCSYGNGLGFVSDSKLHLSNLTINGCGIIGTNLKNTVEMIQNIVDLFFNVPEDIQYGMIIANCSEVNINSVNINNTQGLGLLGINVVGESHLFGMNFSGNRPAMCFIKSAVNITSNKTIGGGMYLLYQDYINKRAINTRLSMSHMTFYANSYCGPFSRVYSLYGDITTATELGYVIGTAGAMGISLAQLWYSVDIVVEYSKFVNNTGRTNAGVHLNVFQSVHNSSISLANCEFTNNGFKEFSSSDLLGIATWSAAGLIIFDNIKAPNEAANLEFCDLIYMNPVSINITNTKFIGNYAYSCAAFEVISFNSVFVTERTKNSLNIINSTFRDNHGLIGSAFCGYANERTGFEPSINVTFKDVTVTDNVLQSSSDSLAHGFVESSGHIVFISLNVTLSGDSTFANNTGVAIASLTSLLHIEGNIEFLNNNGIFGGAIRLIASSLIIHNNTNLLFENNKGTVQGGAIYYYSNPIYVSTTTNIRLAYNCFLYFQYYDNLCNYSMSCPDILSMNININFTANTASEGGTIYGSTLNSCPWFFPLKEQLDANNTDTALHLLSQTDQFYFDPPLTNSSVVSTSAFSLNITDISKGIVSPGEEMYLTVKAYNDFGYRTSAAVVSTSLNSSITTHIGESIYFFIHSSDTNGTMVPLNVYGKENQTAKVELFTTSSAAHTVFGIQTKTCGTGFWYNPSNQSCVCLENLLELSIGCDAKEEQLTIPDNHWFGVLNDTLEYTTCVYDYCKPLDKRVSAFNLDSQCNFGYNRTGFVCSRCTEGTSAMFGTSRCGECTNFGLLWILGFAVAGVVMIFSICFIGISISDGYLNGLILYCNFLNYFIVYLSPKSAPIDLIFTPIAWINLGLGIESCFYNGMTDEARIGLRLLFPLYLFTLMAIIVILAKRFSSFAKHIHSASKAFATLILLSYFSVFGTCVEVLSLTPYNGLYNNVSYVGWNISPSVQYGTGWHGLLIAISAVLMLVYVLPMPLLFLFPNVLYSCRWTKKFKPIYDAFWNPFKPKYRFWLGARAILRFVPFWLSLSAGRTVNIFGMVIFLCLVWFIHERISPFEGYWQNCFDTFFMLNLILLFAGQLHFDRYKDDHNDLSYPVSYTVYVYFLLSSVYLAFIIILMIHIFIRFPQLKCNGLKAKVLRRIPYKRKIIEDSPSQKSQSSDNVNIPQAINFSELRESMLEDYGSVLLKTNDKAQDKVQLI